jgi:hypothetical protein
MNGVRLGNGELLMRALGSADFLGATPEAWAATAAWLTFGVLLATLVYAAVQVREAKRLRREQFRPHVVVDGD